MKEKELRVPVKFTPKNWGFEKTITNSNKYLGFFWFVAKDRKCPLHYHKMQDKTIYVHSGKIKIFYTKNISELKKIIATAGSFGIYNCMDSMTLHRGDNFCIPPGYINQIIAVEDSEIYLFSTFPVSGDYFELAKGG